MALPAQVMHFKKFRRGVVVGSSGVMLVFPGCTDPVTGQTQEKFRDEKYIFRRE
jgi:hypothetical protein